MKYLKVIFFLISVLNCNLYADNNLREKIAVIEVELNNKLSDYFDNLSSLNIERGDLARSELYKNLHRKWYGSGFVIQNDVGEFFLVTNKHVVEFSKALRVTFNNTKIIDISPKNAQIIYFPDYLDVVLIPLSDQNIDLDKYVLEITDIDLDDGLDVWSAGYPSINNSPVWQLSKGIITNSSVQIDDEKIPENAYLIQHSAAIDPGSSGGPLLVKDDDENYLVIGINTWKISNRDNTYLSIPANTVSKLETKSLENNILKELEDRIQSFIDQQNKQEYSTRNSNFMSEKIVCDYGYPIYEELVRSLSPTRAAKLEESFFLHSATDTLREVVYFKLYNMLNSENTTWDVVDFYLKEDGNEIIGETKLSANSDEVLITWIYENNYWKILSFPGIDEVMDPYVYYKNKPAQDYEITGFAVSANIGFPISESFYRDFGTNWSIGCFYNLEIHNPFLFEIGMEIGNFRLQSIYNDDEYSSNGTVSGIDIKTYIGCGSIIKIETENDIQIIPKVIIGLGGKINHSFEFSSDNGEFVKYDNEEDISIQYMLNGILEFKRTDGTGFGTGLILKLQYNDFINFPSYADNVSYTDYFNLDVGGFLKI